MNEAQQGEKGCKMYKWWQGGSQCTTHWTAPCADFLKKNTSPIFVCFLLFSCDSWQQGCDAFRADGVNAMIRRVSRLWLKHTRSVDQMARLVMIHRPRRLRPCQKQIRWGPPRRSAPLLIRRQSLLCRHQTALVNRTMTWPLIVPRKTGWERTGGLSPLPFCTPVSLGGLLHVLASFQIQLKWGSFRD